MENVHRQTLAHIKHISEDAEELENQLAEWIREVRAEGKPLNSELIRIKANQLAEKNDILLNSSATH